MDADVVEDFALRVRSLRAYDDEKLEWLNAFHDQMAQLSRRYKDSCSDLERERIAGRATQQRVEELERSSQAMKQSIDGASFILVLIDADADAYMFKDSYYRDPNGGRKAAMDLQAQVNEHLGKMEPQLAHLPVVIRAFANMDGLSGHLSRLGLISSSVTLLDFARTFSQAYAGSDFVSVGSGKDRADKKVKGVFEQFVRNPTCCHIVFGACHDNGYVRLLEDFTDDPAMVNRITLLHSLSVGKEFQKLPFRSITMKSIFRSSLAEASRNLITSNCHDVSTTALSHSTAAQAWASLNTAEKKSNKSAVCRQVLPQRLVVNTLGQRIDERLPNPVQSAIDSWKYKTRVAQMRYCRLHQLSNSCSGSCIYSHGLLSDDEKLVYRLSLRREVCRTGLECRDWKCPYGHNCFCKKQSCKFPGETHGVNNSIAEVVTEG